MLQPSKGTPEQQPAPLLWLTAHGHRPNCLAKETRATRQCAAGGRRAAPHINPALSMPGSLKHKPQM